MKGKQSFFDLARLLAVIGGTLTLFAGFVEFGFFFTRRSLPSLDLVASTFAYGVAAIVLGLIAIVGSRHVKTLAWDFALVIVGVVAYPIGGGFPWGWGPILILVGGVLAILALLA